jgi:hypothetical protein
MFLQLMQGRVVDRDLLSRQADRWEAELRSGASGFLGSTWGIAADGTAVFAARFDSEAAARANSDRPEQSRWWTQTAPAFDEVSFQDCSVVDTVMGGGSDQAGFVQLIHGRVKDEATARALLGEAEAELGRTRPDILGMTMAWHGEGAFTQIVYFRTEAEARASESAATGTDLDERYLAMMAEPPTFIDLTEPHFS